MAMADKEEVIASQETEKEVEQAAEQDAFTASFETNARADEAPAAEQNAGQTETVAEVASESNADVNTDAVDDAPPEEKAGVTAEQLTAMLAKMPKIEEVEKMTASELSKVHGKLGEFNRALQELKKNGEGNKQSVKLAGATFKRLHENFPELAELLAEDLNEAGTSNTGDTTVQNNNVDFEQSVAQVREDLSKDMQKNLLLLQHRDFVNVIQSDDFKVWKQTLPEEDQQKLDDSWDAMYLGEKLTEFKDWHGKKQTGTQERRERLQRAITPQGMQKLAVPQAQTEQDGFNAAFKK